MNHLARKPGYSQAVQEYGQVLGREEALFVIETDGGRFRARRAVSCVVEPEPGDKVLISISTFGDEYVLAVLEREPSAKVTLLFDTDVDLKTRAGRLSIAARDRLDLLCENDLNLLSSGLGVTASVGKINIQRLSFWGALFEGSIDAVKLLADTFESFLKRFSRITKHSYRQVEELDRLKCGRLHYQAKQTLQLRGEVSQLTAKEDVFIDGERINIG